MSRNYTSPPVVKDGDTVFADDVNDLSTAAESAVTLLEAEIDGLTPEIADAVEKAEEWAENPEDDDVEPGKFSSLHHSAKSAGSATDAGNSADSAAVVEASVVASEINAANCAGASYASELAAQVAQVAAETAQGLAETAQGGAETAEINTLASELKAQKWAEELENIEVETGKYSALHWAAKAEAFATAYLSDVDVTAPITVDKTNPLVPIIGWAGDKTDVGLANVDNTSDANKPISTATQSALDLKVAKTSDIGSAVMPKGTTAQRDGTPLSGYMRFNTDEATFEGHDGTEWGAIGGGGGLEWITGAIDVTAEDGEGHLIDTTLAVHTVTLPITPEVGETVGVGDWKGTANEYNITIARNGSLIMGLAEDLILDEDNDNVTLVYANATQGWKIVTSNPVALGSPLIANKPLLHIQDQKATGAQGGSSVVGDQDRDLNTILTNEITGATLSSNEVTLPAGEYYIAASIPGYKCTRTRSYLKTSANTTLLTGGNNITSSVDNTAVNTLVFGKITLTSTTVIKLVHYIEVSLATSGLGSATSQAPYEVYSDLRIWRLDQEIHTPVVASPPNTVVAGVPVTGNIMGLDYAMNSGSPLDTVDVNPGSTMDDTLVEEMILASTTQLQLITPAINTIYHLFVTKDAGTVGVEYNTDENYPSFTGDYKRWIGFVLTDGSGDIVAFYMTDTIFTFNNTQALGSAFGASYIEYSITDFVPVSRCAGVKLNVVTTSVTRCTIAFTLAGSTTYSAYCAVTTGTTYPLITAKESYWFRAAAFEGTPYISGVTLKR